tara:strand:- start:371 stop:1204 length:834 start_codon:yes stop_codon:yes gene_type:complete
MASEIKVDTIVNAGGDNDSGIDLSTNDQVKIKIAGTNMMTIKEDGELELGTTSSSDSEISFLAATDGSSRINFGDSGDANIGVIQYEHDGNAMVFKGNANERMRVDSSGNVLIGKTAAGTAAGVQLEPTGTANIARSGDLCMVLDRLTNTGEIVSIRTSNVAKGGITVNSGSVSFNTSSDYRLKENVTTSWDATTRLKQLKPVRFSWKVDSKSEADTDGFLAHEVSSVVPEATSGEKDAVDADGNPKHQGIDHSKLVALLVKTVQELEARIATLESK